MRIDWFVTRICDQAAFCRFCYAPWNFFPSDVDTPRALEICDRLKELGVNTVTLCGGEPFMYPGLEAVVRRLHSHGIKVVLYTSGTSDLHDVRTFVPLVDFLSLAVDAVTPAIVEKMRGRSQSEKTASILAMLKEQSSRPRIKIGTVVTMRNVHDLPAIGDHLAALGIVDVWRLYEFSPYGIGKHNERRYLLGPGAFAAAVALEKARNVSRERPLLISERDRAENADYCMIMDSRGSFYRYAERYIPLGVTVDDPAHAIIAGYDRDRHERQKSWHATA